MALQDLTPQLRTRLSRMERAVGLFVILAVALLLFGFVYYIYKTAERKGWFKIKAPYFTYAEAATGLKVGDPVKLMGLDVGRITRMEPMSPWFNYNIYVEFEITQPYYGYVWSVGSQARVATADLLGSRSLEITKGTGGNSTYLFRSLRVVTLSEAQNLSNAEMWRMGQDIYDSSGTNLLVHAGWPLSTNLSTLSRLGLKEIRIVDHRTEEKQKTITAVWNDHQAWYEPFYKTNMYWLKSDESPALTQRLEALVDEVQKALPNILNLTNQLITVLSNTTSLTSNLNEVALSARPAVSNVSYILASAHLDQPGGLGLWLFPTNISESLEHTLGSAEATLSSANTNLSLLAAVLEKSLINLADLTGNLNGQVQSNTNLVSQISHTIADADNFVQGLKRHWLLRSAFKSKTANAPALSPAQKLPSPKERLDRNRQ